MGDLEFRPIKRHELSIEQRYLSTTDDYDELRAELGRALYWSIYAALTDEGVDAVRASKRALRSARAFVFDRMGWSQAEVAELLDASVRTLRSDLARAQAVCDSGALRERASRSQPPVPGAWDFPVRAIAGSKPTVR